MGLFSTLTESTGTAQAISSNGSGEIPTVIQLYTTSPIQMDETSTTSGYTALTYQAVQVGSGQEEVKNRHQNPDLGVWNCRVSPGEDKQPLVDALLAKVAPNVGVFNMTVNLEDPDAVEPSISLMQSALVRHLIENPQASGPEAPTCETATTSLYQLQAVQFGKANEDDKTSQEEKNYNESFKDVFTSLMICAVLPRDEEDAEAEAAFRKKQGQALLIYHLRKFAAALNASLCFVQPDLPLTAPPSQPPSPTKESKQAAPSETVSSQQPTVNFDKLSEYWRDLAMNQKVWEEGQNDDPAPAEEESEKMYPSTAIYGPGQQQEVLIESVLLRAANYPGHWDANKDSLWVALPSSDTQATSAEASTSTIGDQGWLRQLRESIASADLPPAAATATETPAEADKPEEKDAAEVTDFFASLLKKP